MAISVESRGFADEVEPVTLLTEGAAGLAAIVLAIIALAGISPVALVAIAAIVIGVGLMVQAFNSAAEQSNMNTMMSTAAGPVGVSRTEFGGAVMVDCMCGLTGIVLGILALVGINPAHLLPPALIVFGGALLVGGAACLRPTVRSTAAPGSLPGTEGRVVAYQGSSTAAGGMEILIGLAAIILGIVSLLVAGAGAGVLVPVGFIAVGAALLLASATFSGAVMRMFTTA